MIRITQFFFKDPLDIHSDDIFSTIDHMGGVRPTDSCVGQ